MKFAKLISLTALLVLVACSSDDEPMPADTPTNVIVFSCGAQETEQVTTRAGETSLHDVGIGSFRVWAYKNDGMSGNSFTSYQTVMDSYRVRWEPTLSTSNLNNWEYVEGTTQTIKYWDISVNAYRFMAIAPATTLHNASITGDTDKSLSIRMPIDATNEADVPYYSELWFSTGSPIDYPDKQFLHTVNMRFMKPISYVRFMFTYERPEEAATTTLTGKIFKPTDGGLIEQKGDVTISYPITGTGINETLTVSETGLDGITAFTQDYYVTPADANACKYYTVLPATNQGTYTLKVTVNGEPKSLVVPEAYMDWLPGYEYTYIFKVRASGGVVIDNVQSAFTGWTLHEGQRKVYNW
jgi:hypothetical protein